MDLRAEVGIPAKSAPEGTVNEESFKLYFHLYRHRQPQQQSTPAVETQ
jgi:hypothetical protein